MDLVRELSKKIIINGNEIEVCVEIHTELENEKPDFDYGSEAENKKEMARFNSGELENVCIRVQASFKGIVGTDYLGQCFVRANKFAEQVIETVDEYGMIENATRELEAQLNLIAIALNKKEKGE